MNIRTALKRRREANEQRYLREILRVAPLKRGWRKRSQTFASLEELLTHLESFGRDT